MNLNKIKTISRLFSAVCLCASWVLYNQEGEFDVSPSVRSDSSISTKVVQDSSTKKYYAYGSCDGVDRLEEYIKYNYGFEDTSMVGAVRFRFLDSLEVDNGRFSISIFNMDDSRSNYNINCNGFIICVSGEYQIEISYKLDGVWKFYVDDITIENNKLIRLSYSLSNSEANPSPPYFGNATLDSEYAYLRRLSDMIHPRWSRSEREYKQDSIFTYGLNQYLNR